MEACRLWLLGLLLIWQSNHFCHAGDGKFVKYGTIEIINGGIVMSTSSI